MSTPLSSHALDAWLRLADALDANVGTEALDLELLVQQSQQAARGLRTLVAAVRATMPEDASAPIESAPAAPEDEVWVPDGMGGGTRMKVEPSAQPPSAARRGASCRCSSPDTSGERGGPSSAS